MPAACWATGGGGAQPHLRRSPDVLANRFALVDHGQVRSLCERHVGTPVQRLSPEPDGMGGVVFRGWAAGARVIVKLQPFVDVHPLDDEARFLLLFSSCAAPRVPKLLAFDSTAELVTMPAMVSEELPGSSIARLVETGCLTIVGTVAVAAAAALAQLHEYAVQYSCRAGTTFGHEAEQGPVHSDGPLSKCARHLAPHMITEAMRGLALLQRASLLDSVTAEKWRGLVAEPSVVSPSHHLHGDPSLRNFLWFEDEVSGVIDGGWWLGPSECDLAALLVFVANAWAANAVRIPATLAGEVVDAYVLASSGARINEDALEVFFMSKLAARLATIYVINPHSRALRTLLEIGTRRAYDRAAFY